jgi:hypothetical protein
MYKIVFREVSILKKVIFNLCFFAAIVFSFTACSNDSSSLPPENAGSTRESETETNEQELLFPASMDGKTEYNTEVYDVNPFIVKVTLPKGWTAEEEKKAPLPMEPGFSNYIIKNEDGERVGLVGYNIYKLYEGAENDPKAVYSQLTLGSHYCFDVQNTYRAVKSYERGETAMAVVHYSEGLVENDAGSTTEKGKKDNIGILSNDKNRLVYVAFDLDSDRVSQEQAEKIAESLVFED